MRIGLRVTFISYTKSSAKPLQSRQHAIQGIYSPNPFKERKKIRNGKRTGEYEREREGRKEEWEEWGKNRRNAAILTKI